MNLNRRDNLKELSPEASLEKTGGQTRNYQVLGVSLRRRLRNTERSI